MAAIAAATYGMNPLFALPLYQAGLNPDSVLFFRYLIAIPILGGMIKIRGGNFAIRRKEILLLAVMGLLVSISSLSLFQSYTYMDAGIASTLLFVYPVMVALIMALFFREKVTRLTTGCLLMTLVGIGLLYRGSDGSTLSLTGLLFVMTSALTYAVYIVGINRPILKNIPTLKVTFYVLLFGVSLFLVRVDFGTSLIIPALDKWYLWLNILSLAIFPTVISFVCTTGAVQYIGSTPTALLGALEPVTAIFFGVLLFGETLTLRLIAGILLIILAVTLIVGSGNIVSYLVRLRKLFPRR